MLGQVVPPHAGSEHDIGLADALYQIVVGANLEAFDACLAQLEPVLHPVCRMRKADCQTIPRRKHGTPPTQGVRLDRTGPQGETTCTAIRFVNVSTPASPPWGRTSCRRGRRWSSCSARPHRTPLSRS